MRFFFLNYLYSKKRDKSNLIYSHIEFIRKRRTFALQIFFYDSTLREIFKFFGSSILRYVSNNIFSYFISNKNLNMDSLSLLIDSELKQKKIFNYKKNIWLNNFLYLKNYLYLNIKFINLDDNFKIIKLNDVINNVVNFSMLVFLDKSLKINFNDSLINNKNIINYLRKFSVGSFNLINKNTFEKNYNVDYNWLLMLFFKMKGLNFKKFNKNPIIKTFFPFYNKSLSAYSFINNWFFFNIMDSTIINSELILKLINSLGLNKSYKFFNRYNRIVNIDLNSVALLFRSGNIRSIGDLSGKYKDFIGFLLFNFKKRNWYFKYMLKSYFTVYNNLTLNYYSLYLPFSGNWRYLNRNITLNKQSNISFKKFINWKNNYYKDYNFKSKLVNNLDQ